MAANSPKDSKATHRRRQAFSLPELLAIVAILVLLAAIFIPYFQSVTEGNRRAICVDNLRRLRQALQDYAGTDSIYHSYPRVVYDPEINRCGYTAFTGPDADDPFLIAQPNAPTTRPATAPAVERVQPSDVTASLWLLVREQYITDLSVFVCPSSSATPDSLTDAWGHPVPVSRRSNFRSPNNLSYSYADPFSGYADYRLISDQPGAFALLADRSPGSSAAIPASNAPPLEMAVANSRNHQRAGQNVLHADGSVSFETSPYCGVAPKGADDGDNIFTALAPAPLASGDSPLYDLQGYCGRQYGPSYQYDSYLVPTDEDGR